MILIWQLILKLEWYYAFVRNFMMRSNNNDDNVIFAVYWRLNFSHAAANPTWYRRQMKHIFLSLLIYQNIKNVWHIKSNAFARTIYKYTKWLGKSWECRRSYHNAMSLHVCCNAIRFGISLFFRNHIDFCCQYQRQRMNWKHLFVYSTCSCFSFSSKILRCIDTHTE